MKRALFLSILLMIFMSCNTRIVTKNNTTIWWINSYKVSCTGVAPMSCLQIQKNKTIEQGKWQNFYTGIDGFDFEPGYLQKIRVKELKINPTNVPADDSLIKYKLVRVLEKKADERFAIHDIWALEKIEGVLLPKPIENTGLKTPVLEINVTEMKVMGSDGCNRITGEITILDGEKLEFGNMATTKRLCSNMDVANKFNKTLLTVRKFKKEGLKLILYNESGNEVLSFEKVD